MVWARQQAVSIDRQRTVAVQDCCRFCQCPKIFRSHAFPVAFLQCAVIRFGLDLWGPQVRNKITGWIELPLGADLLAQI
jgi:hypothetical protein